MFALSLQHVGLRRGDIVVALRRTGDGGQVLDVRWDTCRRVAELIVRNHQRCRQLGSSDGTVVQLKIVTPITAVAATMTSDSHGTSSSAAIDPNKVRYSNKSLPSIFSSKTLYSNFEWDNFTRREEITDFNLNTYT